MELSAADFSTAISVQEFRRRWNDFIRPDDLLVAHNHNSIRLLKNAGCEPGAFEVLKSINYDPQREFQSLGDFFQARSVSPTQAIHPGRGGKRLANVVTMVRYLNAMI